MLIFIAQLSLSFYLGCEFWQLQPGYGFL